jgi:hypothetical protein
MSASYLFSTLFHLPMLAVLIVGLVLVGQRRAVIGRRSTMLARIGLIVLVLAEVLQAAWTVAIPLIYSALDNATVASLGLLSGLVGVILSLLAAVGIALVIAAVVSRNANPGPAAGYAEAGYPGPGYPPA